MPVRYVLKVMRHRGNLFEAVVPTDAVTIPAQLDNFDPITFGPGLFVVVAGKVHVPNQPMILDDLKEWFAGLDGLRDKEVGGLVICKVMRLT